LPRNEKIRGDGVAGLAQILRVEEGKIVTGPLPGLGQGGEACQVADAGQHRCRSSVVRGVDVFYLIDGVLDDAVEAGIALGIFAGQKAEGSTLLRNCPDSVSRLAVDDVLRRNGRSGAVVAHGLDELGVLLGIGLAALLGTANDQERPVISVKSLRKLAFSPRWTSRNWKILARKLQTFDSSPESGSSERENDPTFSSFRKEVCN